MELTNRCTVGLPVEQVWAALGDLACFAPCLPGVVLDEGDGDEYRGTFTVALGAATVSYDGAGGVVERDDAARRVVVRATGRERNGVDRATATVTITLAAAASGTEVRVVTDLDVTGRPAQLGEGVLGDVASRLLGQFATGVEADVRRDGPGAGDDSRFYDSMTPPFQDPPPADQSVPRPTMPRTADDAPAGRADGVRRLAPIVAALAVVTVLAGWWRRRRHG
ncbi:MAG: SRPBCC family protein [Acidimicrobiales bacterium]